MGLGLLLSAAVGVGLGLLLWFFVLVFLVKDFNNFVDGVLFEVGFANTALFIQRALSPAHISTIRLDEENRKAEVFLRPEEVSLAIGKNGHNIKLATTARMVSPLRK